jgi:hypothetical protein
MEPEEELHGREFLEGRDTTRFQLAKPLLVFSRKACKGQFVLKERKCGGINHSFLEHESLESHELFSLYSINIEKHEKL